MKWFKEIQTVGIVDWIWFVIYMRRNEFHPRLDRCRWRGTSPELVRARNRAHNIDDKLTTVSLMKEIKTQ